MHLFNWKMLVGTVGFLLPIQAAAQVTEASLSKIFRSPIGNIFHVGPGVTMKVIYGSERNACVLTIQGSVTETQVKEIFDSAVPFNARGAKKEEIMQCAGLCSTWTTFQNVYLLSSTTAGQIATPAALIIFSRPECDRAAEEARRVAVQITRRDPGSVRK